MTNAPLSIACIRSDQQDAAQALNRLRERLSPQGDVVSEAGRERTLQVFGQPLTPRQVAERICNDVAEEGAHAVFDYAKRIDQVVISADTMRVPEAELAEAHRQADPNYLATIKRIRENVTRFQQGILHRDQRIELPHGGYLAQRYRPLKRIGICIPGGAAAYPSTLLMTAVPAQVAGVKELAVVAPPTEFGSYNTDLLAACHELGITEVYRLGGAQAVAAMAYGIEGLPAVEKIVGPGNLFVALAKEYVFGSVDIDSISGPSEVVVVADGKVSPEFVAADLIAQAEHSPGSSILITWDETLYHKVPIALAEQLEIADRGDLARASLLEFGAIVLTKTAEEACEIATSFAPEHLHIMSEDAEGLLDLIPTAGAAFLGTFSPVALGDYVAGPSHVLPTSGTARFANGLSANDFLRPHSVIHYSAADLASQAADVRLMAEKEGLTAHWHSVKLRLDDSSAAESTS